MIILVKALVTTSLKYTAEIVSMARKIAYNLNIQFVHRGNFSLADLEEKFDTSGILVVSKDRFYVYIQGEDFFFHPGMAKMRIKGLKNGNNDQMISAMNLKSGDSVLDCTVGLGSDAVVANYVVGNDGKVTGLESNSLIAYVVREGIKEYENPSFTLTMAVKGIEVINADHRLFLKEIPDKSFDVVYFDPMFREPVYKSSGMMPLRKLANYDPIDINSVNEACRVAKKRVVIKERSNSDEFHRLGCIGTVAGKKSPIAYGYIAVGGDDN
ncbi:MAG: hypothetical protein FH758_01185 [Firmicutes bacterium]|nr:hypothetical protein [Bacillota bacterium]